MYKQEPAFQWYPSDWRTSPAFLCSISARGLWREMIDMMHNAERPGYLSIAGQPIPSEEIARYCGLNLEDYEALLAELFAHQVPRRTSNGVIFSHRMVSDFKKRKDYRKWKENQRDRDKKETENPDVRVLVRPMSGPSSSSSSSSSQKKKKNPAAKPAPLPDEPKDTRHQECVEFSQRTFCAKHGGLRPTWAPRDYKALKELLSHTSVSFIDFAARWQHFLASTETFTAKQGDSLRYFCDHFDIFLEGPLLDIDRRFTGGRNGLTAEQRIKLSDEAAERYLSRNRAVAPDLRPDALSAITKQKAPN